MYITSGQNYREEFLYLEEIMHSSTFSVQNKKGKEKNLPRVDWLSPLSAKKDETFRLEFMFIKTEIFF